MIEKWQIFIIYVISIIASLLITRFIFKADIPIWLKYWLLGEMR